MMIQRVSLLVLTCIALAGCETAYYSAMEKVGLHKRDILVDRVEDVRDSQVDVKEQFSSALERFTVELNFDGGELEKVYKTLDEEYQDSLNRAEDLSANIDKVEDVAADLFEEWEQELDQYSNASLKRQSARQLRETRAHYKRMLSAMHSAEKKMFPVLETLHDQVLFLKHNLNARAIASLKGEFGSLKRDIKRLIADMEKSIQASESFMETLQ